MKKYKIPPPLKLILSIEGFFERARQQNQITGDVDPKIVAQWIFGAMLGRRFLSKTTPPQIDDVYNTVFIESTAKLLWSGIKEQND